MNTPTTPEQSPSPGSTFSFEFLGASRLRTDGAVAFDTERKQWRSTIIAQREPELRFDAWDDDPAIASLMVCAKWMGRDMSKAEVSRPATPK